MLPIVVGLKMVDVSLYEKFISGKNPEPMINVFNTEEFKDLIGESFLGQNESFNIRRQRNDYFRRKNYRNI